MAPVEITDDYYAILEIAQTASIDEIKFNYKRLARQRHPDKNPGNPRATAEFQLLQAAFSTLSDAALRRDYDARHYPSIRSVPKPGTKTNTPYQFSDPDPAAALRHKQELESINKALAALEKQKAQYERDVFAATRNRNRCDSAIRKLQEEAKMEAEEEAKAGWFSYLFGPAEPQAEREAKQRRKTERGTGQIVREAERSRHVLDIIRLNGQVREITDKMVKLRGMRITAEGREESRLMTARWQAEAQRKRAEQEARKRAEEKRKEEDAKRQKEEEARMEREWRRRQEQAAKERAEAIRKQNEAIERQEREAKEQEQKEFAMKREREEAERARAAWIRQEALRRTKEHLEKAKEASGDRSQHEESRRGGRGRGRGRGGRGGRAEGRGGGGRQPAKSPGSLGTPEACQHKGWWSQRMGSQQCQVCRRSAARFVFCCPGCDVVACAPCRDHLKRLT